MTIYMAAAELQVLVIAGAILSLRSIRKLNTYKQSKMSDELCALLRHPHIPFI